MLVACTSLAQHTAVDVPTLFGSIADSADPLFTVSTYSTASELPNLSRLNIVVNFVNDELQFITTPDKRFRADYRIDLMILDGEGGKVDSTNWSGQVFAEDFDETVSVAITHTTRGSLDLPPGEYKYHTTLLDLETRSPARREGEVVVRAFPDSTVSLSDVAILDASTLQQTMNSFNEIELADSVRYAFFEIYNLPPADSAVIQYELSEPISDKLLAGQTVVRKPSATAQIFFGVADPKVVAGESKLKLKIAVADTTFELERALTGNTEREVNPEIDLKDAIDQLTYLAKGDEFKNLKKAKGEEQLAEFKKFWEKRDPTPGTRKNEYYDEYYRRVEFANRTFDTNNSGWRTDRGMVYILLGSPDFIERPLNSNDYFDSFSGQRPYVIWHYYRFNRRAVFRYDIGEYRIANHHEIFDLLNDGMRY
jgi:GWxTD domain-containing protein